MLDVKENQKSAHERKVRMEKVINVEKMRTGKKSALVTTEKLSKVVFMSTFEFNEEEKNSAHGP